jgi:hypothetical protein
MGKYDELQLNGVCWDCGKQGWPVCRMARALGTVDRIGWKCICGRKWGVAKSDMYNWCYAAVLSLALVPDRGDE